MNVNGKNVSQVLRLFPTPVHVSSLSLDTIQIERDLLRYFPEVKQNSNNFMSVEGQVLEHFSLAHLKTELLNSVKSYLTEVLQVKYDECFISSSWYNVNTLGSYHISHSHGNSYVSGVFYVNAPSDVEGGEIVFSNDNSYLSKYSIEPAANNDFNSPFQLKPQTNMLVLFPSTLVHSVNMWQGIYPRISLSFNVFFKGIIGNHETRTFLKI